MNLSEMQILVHVSRRQHRGKLSFQKCLLRAPELEKADPVHLNKNHKYNFLK